MTPCWPSPARRTCPAPDPPIARPATLSQAAADAGRDTEGNALSGRQGRACLLTPAEGRLRQPGQAGCRRVRPSGTPARLAALREAAKRRRHDGQPGVRPRLTGAEVLVIPLTGTSSAAQLDQSLAAAELGADHRTAHGDWTRPGDHDGGHPHDSSWLTRTAVDDVTCRLQDGPSRPGIIARWCRSGVGVRISGGASSSTRRTGCRVVQGERPAAGQAAPDAFEVVLVVIVVNCGPCTIKGVEAQFSLDDRSLVPGRGNKPVSDSTALPSGCGSRETRPRRARCRGS